MRLMSPAPKSPRSLSRLSTYSSAASQRQPAAKGTPRSRAGMLSSSGRRRFTISAATALLSTPYSRPSSQPISAELKLSLALATQRPIPEVLLGGVFFDADEKCPLAHLTDVRA